MSLYREASAGNLELEKALVSIAEGNTYMAEKAVTYAAATTGATGASTLFNVTGNVLCYIVAVCGTNLAGASATIEVGVTGATAALIAQTTGTDIDANEGWYDATPTLAEANTPQWHVIGGGLDIKQTIATAAVSAGQITYYCFWKPLSETGRVEAA